MGEPVATADPDEPAPPYLEMSGLEDLGPLPEGWSLKWHGVGETRRPYFINHTTRQTTWDDPRKNRTPVAPPARTTSSQSRPTAKQQEQTKTTMSEEEIMAKAIALSIAEAEEKKKKQPSMTRPKPTTTYRPTTSEITTNVYDNNTANSTSLGPATLAAESSTFTSSANSSTPSTDIDEPAAQNQNEARAKGPNPALRKGPNPDLLLSERVEAKGPDPSLCKGPKGLARGPQARIAAA